MANTGQMAEQPPAPKTLRNHQLDVLRAIAVVMVMVCHSIALRKPTWDVALWRPGWSGVDLFFVISGFLISGLLFSEFRRTGQIHFARFFIRRGFKIYPAFYVLVCLTTVWQLFCNKRSHPSIWPRFVNDIFFLQAYREGTWGHFWSLSVEEHFYLLLPLALWLMIRFRKGAANPFEALPVLFLVVAVGMLVARLLTAKFVRPFQMQTHLFPTHLRLDSLLFGVLLGYYFHFHRERLTQFVTTYREAIFCAGLILLSPLFFIGQYNQWMYTYGFTAAFLGYGCLMMALLHIEIDLTSGSAGALLRGVAYVGTFSYSIYLWHVPWLIFVRALPLESTVARLCCFYGGAILLGIFAGNLIETPALRLRETLFPRLTQADVVPLQNTMGVHPIGLTESMMDAECSKAA